MKRLITSAAVTAVLVAGSGSGAQAQDARASLFDLSVYGGIGYDYNWLKDLGSLSGFEDDRLNPGFAPGVGAAATFWASDRLGIRTNVWYQDVDLPENSRPDVVNAWFYDLNLVLRPWVTSTSSPRLLSSVYLFLGGGAFTANPPGDDPGCVEPYASRAGACLPLDWKKATVGQGTAGFGWDLISLTSNIGLFTELAGYVYDSPFHTGPAWTGMPENDRDTYGLTGRLTAGLKFSFGNRAPVVVAPPMPPPPPPAAPAPPPPPPPPATRDISVCVVANGNLQTVTATFNPANNDTTVSGQAFATAHPVSAPNYAAGAPWFINTDTLTFNNSEFVKFGVARMITNTSQLQRVGEFQGTSVFAETGATAPYQVLYVPLRPGCEFQPYSPRPRVRG